MKPIHRCTDCGLRWAHEQGICRRCARVRGDLRTNRDREAEQIARAHRRHPGVRREPRPARICRPVVYDGEAYEVIWEGTCGELSPVTDDLESVTAVMRW